jgi:multicomponent Na+:H+ antiporter subunit G
MTLDLVRDVVSWLLIVGGGIFLVIGAIGLNRMPDVFTRMHATSVSDTFGAGLMLVGLMVQSGVSLVTVKLLFLLLCLWFTAPIATHALARAALLAGCKPALVEESPLDGDAPKDVPTGDEP